MKYLEQARLLVFLAMLIRFYLGSVKFFDKVYISEATAPGYANKDFGIDFGVGFIHFLIFFSWSLTIADEYRSPFGMSKYLWFLTVVLLYDALWIGLSWKKDTRKEIKLWTAVNVATFILGVILFFVGKALEKPVLGEWLVLVPVAFFTAIDFVEMTTERESEPCLLSCCRPPQL